MTVKRGPGRPRKNPDAPRRGRPKANGLGKLLKKLRAERDTAIDRATALGTAIEALEAVE